MAEWITYANLDPEPDTCTLTKDIVLEAALPAIDSDITVEGAGYFISGNSRYRVFYVNQGAHLTVNRITLKNGRLFEREYDYKIEPRGGAIYNDGRLTVTNSTFFNNVVQLHRRRD